MFRKFLEMFLLNERGSLMDEGEGDDADNSNDGGDGSSDDGNTNTSSASDDSASIQYPEGFEEGLKGNKTLEKFLNEDKKTFNYANIMKSYAHMEKVWGGDKMPVPTKSFTEEQWKQTFQKLGVPESFEGYDLKNNVPENIKPNEKLVESLRKKSHELSLLPTQAQGILDHINVMIGEETLKNNQKIEEQIEAQTNELKQEWGGNYDKNIKIAKAGLKQFTENDEMKYLHDAGFLDDKVVKKVFHKIGAALSEDKHFSDDGRGTYGMGEDDIQKEINSITQKDQPFWNSADPQHQYFVDKHFKLQQKLQDLREGNA
jgi:hypothetical protein